MPLMPPNPYEAPRAAGNMPRPHESRHPIAATMFFGGLLIATVLLLASEEMALAQSSSAAGRSRIMFIHWAMSVGIFSGVVVAVAGAIRWMTAGR